MATSIGQYATVFLPGEPLSDRGAWQATVYRVTMSWKQLKQPCMHRCKTFFACVSSAPVRAERECGAAA